MKGNCVKGLVSVILICSMFANGVTVVATEKNVDWNAENQQERTYLDERILQMSKELPETLTLTFVGDMNLDESWATTQYLNKQNGNIHACISEELIQQMRAADIFMPNNEFTYSLRGSKTPGKMWTFRANPARVSVMQELGADIVLLANNHSYDYGPDSLLDTLETLKNADISYVGAGKNLEEAISPFYFVYGDMVIAYVAASKAEVHRLTPQATDTTPGILRCYDASLFLQEIAEAKKHADFVIASIHWGTEGSNYVVQDQQILARQMIDAGADAIIGSHPHVLQGIEFYNQKPIMYSLGNFWFNGQTAYTCLYELELDTKTKTISKVKFTPAIQKNCTTLSVQDVETRNKIFRFEEKLSFSVQIDEEGYVTPK